MSARTARLRVLTLARSYPNPVMPLLGLWTRRLVHCLEPYAETKVVSPVPWAPPATGIARLADFTRFRAVPRGGYEDEVEVLHPRMLIGPGHTTHRFEGAAYAVAAARCARKLRRGFPFDLVHAHFTYPDGVAACLLARRYGVPVVITETVPWPLYVQGPRLVARQATWAAEAAAALVPVSDAIRRSLLDGLGVAVEAPVPLVLDDAMMQPPVGVERKPAQLLFVGVVRRVKGLDVLLDALALLRARRPDARLVIVGDPFYRSYRRDFDAAMAHARALGVDTMIDVVGGQAPGEVARLMAESAALVVPSRYESFCSVVVESLACGTPVVATRCGGTEELVTDEVGRLVPTEDPEALAGALAAVLDEPGRYDADALRRHAVERCAGEVVGARMAAIYASVLGRTVAQPAFTKSRAGVAAP